MSVTFGVGDPPIDDLQTDLLSHDTDKASSALEFLLRRSHSEIIKDGWMTILWRVLDNVLTNQIKDIGPNRVLRAINKLASPDEHVMIYTMALRSLENPRAAKEYVGALSMVAERKWDMLPEELWFRFVRRVIEIFKELPRVMTSRVVVLFNHALWSFCQIPRESKADELVTRLTSTEAVFESITWWYQLNPGDTHGFEQIAEPILAFCSMRCYNVPFQSVFSRRSMIIVGNCLRDSESFSRPEAWKYIICSSLTGRVEPRDVIESGLLASARREPDEKSRWLMEMTTFIILRINGGDLTCLVQERPVLPDHMTVTGADAWDLFDFHGHAEDALHLPHGRRLCKLIQVEIDNDIELKKEITKQKKIEQSNAVWDELMREEDAATPSKANGKGKASSSKGKGKAVHSSSKGKGRTEQRACERGESSRSATQPEASQERRQGFEDELARVNISSEPPAPRVTVPLQEAPAPWVPVPLQEAPAPWVPVPLQEAPAPWVPVPLQEAPAPWVPVPLYEAPAPWVPVPLEDAPPPPPLPPLPHYLIPPHVCAKDRLVLLTPCFHKCVCRECALELINMGGACPVCQEPVDFYMEGIFW